MGHKKKKNQTPEKTSTGDKNKKLGIILLFAVILIVIVAIYVLFMQPPTGDPDNGIVTPEGNPTAVFSTSMGTFKVELFLDTVPITAQNFIDHVNSGYYDGVIFHRVMPNFMIQGGDPNGDGTGGHAAKYHEGYGIESDADSWAIPDEFHEDLSNVRETISMANSGPNTGGSQFFINVVDNTYLDYDKEPLTSKHAVFGKVIEGMDIVDAISQVDTGSDTKPEIDVVITSIVIEN